MSNSSSITNNSYVEEIDLKTESAKIVSDNLSLYNWGGLTSAACLVAMPEENAFAITGGNIYNEINK
jgi:hypothetical protein